MRTLERPLLALPAGDPAGVGPDIVCSLREHDLPADLVVIGDLAALGDRARLLGLPADFSIHDGSLRHPLSVIDCPVAVEAKPGKPSVDNATAILGALERAARLALAGEVDGIVTAPVSKAVLSHASPGFTGQTEHLGRLAEVDRPVMAMVSDSLRIALATTHLPLAKVSAAITSELVLEVLRVADKDARRLLGMARPRWKVCGLNPHAGEDGLLGDEEQESIVPGIDMARAEGIDASGPYPADTAFLPGKVGKDDFFLAMYHDQALPVIKRDDFAGTVNVTLGLPFIRTSVDHGTAYDIAGSGKADVRPMLAAVDLAARMATLKKAQ